MVKTKELIGENHSVTNAITADSSEVDAIYDQLRIKHKEK